MKRILLVMSVAALTAAMVLVTAVPAFATIHELADMERAADEASDVVQTESPPGTSEFGSPSFVRSVQAVQTEGLQLTEGGRLLGENPSGGAEHPDQAGDSTNAFQSDPLDPTVDSNPGNK